jgi:hypothetical protein
MPWSHTLAKSQPRAVLGPPMPLPGASEPCKAALDPAQALVGAAEVILDPGDPVDKAPEIPSYLDLVGLDPLQGFEHGVFLLIGHGANPASARARHRATTAATVACSASLREPLAQLGKAASLRRTNGLRLVDQSDKPVEPLAIRHPLPLAPLDERIGGAHAHTRREGMRRFLD